MGKIVASYLVRVTLRERDDQTIEQFEAAGGDEDDARQIVPTNGKVERIVADALYEDLAYFTADCIKVTSERLDR